MSGWERESPDQPRAVTEETAAIEDDDKSHVNVAFIWNLATTGNNSSSYLLDVSCLFIFLSIIFLMVFFF